MQTKLLSVLSEILNVIAIAIENSSPLCFRFHSPNDESLIKLCGRCGKCVRILGMYLKHVAYDHLNKMVRRTKKM